ncbi:hypothetical protein BST97_12420 [Nonlabens spongiae]|uniref:Uncharacterized protein n=1 Tax=Nonlabens spongiae TaxID=331648 RepID=A0A1W6MMA1_9FLAO|nr:hypothetical protein [Nonlabens spongiae]ARN78733.1 hypothetical protein BST97_12420 [Nonlabens spongiae]
MKLDEIKRGFGEREIQPSAGSWNKLSAKLDREEKKSRKSYLYWIGAVAAAIVMALMVYPVLTDSFSTDPLPSEQMVDVDQDTIMDRENDRALADDNNQDSEFSVEEQTEKAGAVDEKEGSTGFANAPAASSVAQVTAPVTTEEKSAVHLLKNKRKKAQNTPASQIKKLKIEAIAGVEIPQQKPENANMITAQQEAGELLNSLLGESKAETIEVATHSIKPEQLLRETEWDLEAERRDRLNRGINQGLGMLKNEAFALIGVDQ